jgi:hypothetical protein
MKFVKSMGPVDYNVLKAKQVHLAKRPGYLSRKSLIFDLDETLVHC